MTRKQQKFNSKLDQYYLYQISESLIQELNCYLYSQFPEFRHLISFVYFLDKDSASIYIKGFENSDTGLIHHFHASDVYYTQRHYQHTVRFCTKRLKMYLQYLESEKENI